MFLKLTLFEDGVGSDIIINSERIVYVEPKKIDGRPDGSKITSLLTRSTSEIVVANSLSEIFLMLNLPPYQEAKKKGLVGLDGEDAVLKMADMALDHIERTSILLNMDEDPSKDKDGKDKNKKP